MRSTILRTLLWTVVPRVRKTLYVHRIYVNHLITRHRRKPLVFSVFPGSKKKEESRCMRRRQAATFFLLSFCCCLSFPEGKTGGYFLLLIWDSTLQYIPRSKGLLFLTPCSRPANSQDLRVRLTRLPHQNWTIWVRNAWDFCPIFTSLIYVIIEPKIAPFTISRNCPTLRLAGPPCGDIT